MIYFSYITVIDFDDDAYVRATLQRAEGSREDLKDAVNQVDSDGGTDIADGLQTGYDEFVSSPTDNQKIAILLTDGKDDDVRESDYRIYKEKGWRIFTIGLSEDTDETLLKQIAETTCGEYFKVTSEDAARNAITKIYDKINRIVRPSGETIIQEVMNIFPEHVTEKVFKITASVESFTVTIIRGGVKTGQRQQRQYRDIQDSDVVTSLIRPDGTVVDRDTQDPDVYHALGATYEIYRVNNPMPGEWTTRLESTNTASEGESATLSVVATVPEFTADYHSADYNPPDYKISLSELLRVVQLYNIGAYHCDPNSKDGCAAGDGDRTCTPHDSDYSPQDWGISLSELLRFIQLYNSVGYYADPNGEGGFSLEN